MNKKVSKVRCPSSLDMVISSRIRCPIKNRTCDPLEDVVTKGSPNSGQQTPSERAHYSKRTKI
jgi:hypothetical protein